MNCIIIHGCPSDEEKAKDPERRTYDKQWISWLENKLENKGIKTEIPLMPEPWNAVYANWKEKIDNLDVNENTILIGHSCGCAFLVRWLGDTRKKVKKLILVAPWKIPDDSAESRNGFYDFDINKEIKKNVKDITIFSSEDEEYNGKKSVEIYSEELGGEIVELKGKGHYTESEMGTEEFPELLEKVLK